MTLPVTILIPAYCPTEESLHWLEDCIDSALKQDCKIVVYDDGSPLDIYHVTELYRPHSNIAVGGSRDNHGPAHARNRAAELATTELIFPLDCDDVLAEGAIAKLYEEWDGTPIFPDLWKFGDKNDAHFRLLDWSCKLQKQKLGIAPVNVLHSVDQWKFVGGWDEQYSRQDIYEDSEYNVRLFYTYCARNLHLPLVGYRQHPGSRIKQHGQDSAILARQMLQKVGGYSDMGCCGKKRRTPSNAPAVQPQAMTSQQLLAQVQQLPGEVDGRVLVRYVGGKGKLRHYQRGKHTKYPYKVTYGQLLHVDPNDARFPDEPEAVSPFVRIVKEEDKKKPIPERKPHKKPVTRSSA